MLTDEALLSLALQACDDRDAREILVDALLESGVDVSWTFEERIDGEFAIVVRLAPQQQPALNRFARIVVDVTSGPLDEETIRFQALAAMLLFWDWDGGDYPWQVVRAALVFVPAWLRDIETASGHYLDAVAEQLFGIRRRGPQIHVRDVGGVRVVMGRTEAETDVELRARCLALLGPVQLP